MEDLKKKRVPFAELFAGSSISILLTSSFLLLFFCFCFWVVSSTVCFLNFSLTDVVVVDLKEQMVEPAVNGTKNVIIAAAEAKVRRVVFTSSIGAVYMDPNRSPDVVVDESCWSDLEFCKNTKVAFY